jgi:hypothetical protein
VASATCHCLQFRPPSCSWFSGTSCLFPSRCCCRRSRTARQSAVRKEGRSTVTQPNREVKGTGPAGCMSSNTLCMNSSRPRHSWYCGPFMAFLFPIIPQVSTIATYFAAFFLSSIYWTANTSAGRCVWIQSRMMWKALAIGPRRGKCQWFLLRLHND